MSSHLDILEMTELVNKGQETQENLDNFIEERRKKILDNWTSQQLNKGNDMASITAGAAKQSISQLDTFFASSQGISAVEERRRRIEADGNTQISLARVEEIMRAEKMRTITRNYVQHNEWLGVFQPEIELNFDDELDKAMLPNQ
jgi:hypothetical protein